MTLKEMINCVMIISFIFWFQSNGVLQTFIGEENIRGFFLEKTKMKQRFLDASSHLYKSVCPSVGPSVGRSVGM